MKPQIDRELVREEVQHLDRGALLIVVDRALDLLSDEQLLKALDRTIAAEALAATSERLESLVELAQRFSDECLAGEYYEDHNPRHWHESDLSPGTERFIADCHRLLDRCIDTAEHADHEASQAALQLIFSVMRAIDMGGDDILFFVDDGGPWQFGIDWRRVLDTWFDCLVETADPTEFAEAATLAVNDFALPFERSQLLDRASEMATEPQQLALAELRKTGD